MGKFNKGLHDGFIFFTASLELMPVLEEIPIDELRNSDIFVLQNLSKAAGFDGVCILLGVDFYDKDLVAMNLFPVLKYTPREAFSASSNSSIYIGNDVVPYLVTKALQAMTRRYASLTPPPYQVYDDGNATVPHDERIEANARSKYKHELFMRENGMSHTSISSGDK